MFVEVMSHTPDFDRWLITPRMLPQVSESIDAPLSQLMVHWRHFLVSAASLTQRGANGSGPLGVHYVVLFIAVASEG